jgi:hypothetical protein
MNEPDKPPIVYGFDMAAGTDTACIVIGHKTPDGVLHIEQELFGAEALEMLERLKAGPSFPASPWSD